MEGLKYDKTGRVLAIYTKLMNGCLINKAEEAQTHGVNERSIQRDIDDIRNYLENDLVDKGAFHTVVYDRAHKGYRLEQIYRTKLTNSEVLAACKILLDSRAFTKEEMQELLGKMIDCCVPENNQKLVSELIKNEEFHYVEPRHHKVFKDTLWELGQAIHSHRCIEIEYERMKDKRLVKRKLRPVAIMFSEYYFYVTAFIDDALIRQRFEVENDPYPTIYRIDRIKNLKVLDEKFHIPYNNRFEEGEFRKRVQFMCGGKLQKVQFRYCGNDLDAVLDRLPTAEIIGEEKGTFIIRAEVFGKGIDMWIRSQGELLQDVKILEKKANPH